MDNERTTSETTPLLSWKSLATQTFDWMVLAAAFGWFGYVLLTSGGSDASWHSSPSPRSGMVVLLAISLK